MPKKEEYLVTQEGLDKLKAKLEWRMGDEKMRLAKIVNAMREDGDVSENDGLDLAEEQALVNREEIRKLEIKIRRSKIVTTDATEGVSLGNKVVIKDEAGKERSFEIVSESETDPIEGKISHESPIGAALIGKCTGDVATITTPRGETKYTIIGIS